MPLEAKRSRHVAVAVPEVSISGGIAVGSGQKGTQPQQPDLVPHEARIIDTAANLCTVESATWTSSSVPRRSSASTRTVVANTVQMAPPESK